MFTNIALKSSKRIAFNRATIAQIRAMATTREVTVRDALREAMDEEMARDETVFLIGEEVAQYDGAYKVSKGLWKKYGDNRIVDTPITEMGFTGLAVGAAFAGLKPICEFMTWNFAFQAIDHIINSAARTNYMSGGQINVPIVFRGNNGPGASVSSQHSHDISNQLMGISGLKVVAPYDAYDAKGLLKAAIRDPNPVCVLESELMLGQTFTVGEDFDKDYVLPLDKAKVMREGKDVTLVSYSKGVGSVLAAAEELAKQGISAEVINLRSIRPLDIETVAASVKKTGRIITVEEGAIAGGVGGEVVAQLTETDAFFYLDAPPQRLAVADVPNPYAYNLENDWYVKPEHVVETAKELIARPFKK